MIEAFKDDRIINDHGGMGSCDTSTLVFDKGHAIKYVIDYFSLTKKDAYAFGDGYNDMSLFKDYKHTRAMSNGVNALKQIAEKVIDSNDNHGVAKEIIDLVKD